MAAVPFSVIEPIWVEFAALIPLHLDPHPLGCHRPRVPDRVVFDKLVQTLVFGAAYARVADGTCSATTIRARRDELLEQITVHLDAGYDSGKTRGLLTVLGCDWEISTKGVPLQVGQRGPVVRTNSWHTRGFGKLQVGTERRARVIATFIALANAIIITRNLIHEAWTDAAGKIAQPANRDLSAQDPSARPLRRRCGRTR